MAPARTPRRHRTAAHIATAAAALALTAGGLTAPAGAEPPQGHPNGQPPAQAGEAAGQPAPGNKGTVKVHEVGTPDDDRRNEPKLCEFRIVGFGFPEDAHLEVSIVGHGGPNAGPDAFDATVATAQLSPAGDWAIDGPSLADGMYKLSVENTTAPGGEKQKVFKIDCPEAASGGVAGDDLPPAPEGTGTDATGGDTSVGSNDVTGSDATGSDATSSVAGVTVERPEVLDTPSVPSQPAETRVLGAYLEREMAAPGAQVLAAQGTQATGLAALPRTGLGVAGLLAAAGALLAGGTALQRRSRSAR